MKKQKVKKLDLGTDIRKQREEGWVYNDLYRTDALGGDDIIHDASKIDEVVEAGCVEELRATHLLEHFSHRDTQNILERWYSVMAEGGTIYLEVPNALFHLQMIAEGRAEEGIEMLFGGHLDDGDYHKTAFTPETLERHLNLAGFKSIEIKNESTISATAVK